MEGSNQLSYNVANPNPHSRLKRCPVPVFLMLLVSMAGCAGQADSDDHHLSHVLPPHWPKDLADAALKLEQRWKLVRDDEQAIKERSELSEIVSWLPEVAADTDLDEQQWQPLYDQSESLRVKLAESRSIVELDGEFQRLLELIQRLQTEASP